MLPPDNRKILVLCFINNRLDILDNTELLLCILHPTNLDIYHKEYLLIAFTDCGYIASLPPGMSLFSRSNLLFSFPIVLYPDHFY